MSLSPGEVLLRADWSDGRLTGVSAQVRRPSLLAALRGQPVQAAATLLPLAYAVCTHAQRAAGNAALAAAAGMTVAASVDSVVRSEAMRELVLATFTGAARPLAAAAVRNLADPAALCRHVEYVALGSPVGRWLELQSPGELCALLAGNRAPLALEASARLARWEPPALDAAWLPDVDATGSLAGFPVMDEATCAVPTWHGAAVESGPVARMRQQPLIASLAGRPWLQRWLARVLEFLGCVAGHPGSLGAVSAVAYGKGLGRSAVMTARGVLLHEVQLAAQGTGADLVARYALCAPTEWNFHPRGPLPRWLEGAGAGSSDEAQSLLHHAAEALDPCVECRVAVIDCSTVPRA